MLPTNGIRRLGPDDLAAVVALQAAVTASTPDGYLYPKSERELCAFLDGSLGAVYGVIEDEALTAISLLRLPYDEEPYGTRPFPLVPPADWPYRACFLAYTLVVPAARGRGHQRALLDARMAYARSAGMRWLCAGAHLANVVSWRNLLTRGMVVAGIRADFGYPLIGLLRPLTASALATDAADEITVGAADSARHERVLAEGYVGVRLRPDGAIVYQRLGARP